MSKFNINRFGKTLLWSAKMTQKEILTNISTMFFAFMVPFFIHLLSTYNEHKPDTAANLMGVTQVNILIYVIIAIIGGCWLFNNMKTKEQRIMFKMLPATDLEKFIVRALYVTVVWWIMAFVAFCLADVFRMFISLLVGIDVVKCVIPELASTLFGTSEYNFFSSSGMLTGEAYAFLALSFAWTFWVHSFYVLGGALLRRRQFVLTTLAHFVLGMVLTPIIVHFANGIEFKIELEVERGLLELLLWMIAAVFAVWGVADWILSYKIFRRMQVVNNKWLNL